MTLSSPVTHIKNNHAETKNFKTFVSTNPAALLVLPVNRQQGGDLRWGATPKESPTAMTSGRRLSLTRFCLGGANLRQQNVANIVPVGNEFKSSLRVLLSGL